jgi:hypothetical protein
MHFAQHGLSHLWAQQQRQIRAVSGDDMKIDNTYKSGTSLCGAVTEVSASGRAKTASFQCSVTTVVNGQGWALAVVPDPSDSQDVPAACLAALNGAELPAALQNPYLKVVHKHVLTGGPAGRAARVISVDNVGKELNVWSLVNKEVLDAYQQRRVDVLVPEGAYCKHATGCSCPCSSV